MSASSICCASRHTDRNLEEIITAESDRMPLDFSLLLDSSTSHPSKFVRRLESLDLEDPDDNLGPPFGCRRAASFPLVNKRAQMPSSLKYRSFSESSGLNHLSKALTVSDLKREICEILKADENKNRRPSLTQKKVAFADDRGYELEEVRIMTESSDMPPKLDSDLLRSLIGDAAFEESRPATHWHVNFSQPAVEYLKFRQKIEKENVGLENVLVKNENSRLVGTIKVKNISFEKSVFVRFTHNHWQSFMDRAANYVPGHPGDIFDTFSFDIEIPFDDGGRQVIEFCVCVRTPKGEFWDNNGGDNYELISKRQEETEKALNVLNNAHSRGFKLNFDTLADVTSWSQLATQPTYY